MSRSRFALNPNPALERAFANGPVAAAGDAMTLEGVVVKTGLLLGIMIAAAGAGWLLPGAAALALPAVVLCLGMALLLAFKPMLARPLAVPYAALQGLVLGVVSDYAAARFGDDIVMSAVGLTFGIAAALLAAYATRLIRPSENFRLGVAAVTGGIFLFYVASLVLGLFGVEMPLVQSNSVYGIVFTLVVVVVAAANTVVDFDFVEQGVTRGYGPRSQYEWFAAFAVMTSLVWLYLEILHLLMKLQSRD